MAKGIGYTILLIILILFSPAMASGLTIGPDGILKKAADRRFPDPVTIKAEVFPGLVGGALGNYRLYACREGTFKPIRFQIDEMTEEGDFVFPHGKLSNKKAGNGLLDPRDVLLFMAKDAGDRISKTSWPENTGKGKEIEIIDPIDQARSWVYLFYFEKNPPPLCPLPDYFNYDYNSELLWSEYWKQQLAITEEGKHTNYYTHFSILPKGGGNGENVIDRVKVRSIIKLFFGRITLKKNEENLES